VVVVDCSTSELEIAGDPYIYKVRDGMMQVKARSFHEWSAWERGVSMLCHAPLHVFFHFFSRCGNGAKGTAKSYMQRNMCKLWEEHVSPERSRSIISGPWATRGFTGVTNNQLVYTFSFANLVASNICKFLSLKFARHLACCM
jgi:hypothetical protein